MSLLLWYLNFELNFSFLSQLFSFIFLSFCPTSSHTIFALLTFMSIFTSPIVYIGWFNFSGFMCRFYSNLIFSSLTRRSLECKIWMFKVFLGLQVVWSSGGNDVCNKTIALLHLATAWAHNPLFILAFFPLPLCHSLMLFQHTTGNSWNKLTCSHAGRLTHSHTHLLCSWS